MEYESVGSQLARKVSLSGTSARWMAEYFLRRWPRSAESNPSLPVDLVEQRLKYHLERRDNLDHFIDTYELNEDQWRDVLAHQSATGGSVVLLLQRQWTDDSEELLAAVDADPTAASATYVLAKHRKYLRRWPLTLQRRVVERADLCARLNWLTYAEPFEELWTDYAQDWIAEITEYREHAACLHELVEARSSDLELFLELRSPHVNRVLASTRHLTSIPQQMAVAGLENDPATGDLATYVDANRETLFSLLNNPRCDRSVRDHVRRVLNSLADSDVDAFHRVLGPALLATLDRRDAHPVFATPVVGPYENLRDPDVVNALVERCVKPKGSHARDHDAVALMRNPRARNSKWSELNNAALPVTKHPPVRDVQRPTYARDLFSAATPVMLSDKSVALWRVVLGQVYACHSRDTHWLREKLGEDATTWDTFLALSENWEGTLGELAECAKNLTQP